MRLLGYYVAEGRVDKQKGPFSRPYMIRFAIHEKEIPTIGAELCKLMELEFGIKTHSVLRCIKSGKGVVLSFHCFKTALWFLRFAGIGSKTKRLSQERSVSACVVRGLRQVWGPYSVRPCYPRTALASGHPKCAWGPSADIAFRERCFLSRPPGARSLLKKKTGSSQR